MQCLRNFRKINVTRLNVEHLRKYQRLEKIYPKSTTTTETSSKNKIDDQTIELLERLSLVDCVNKEDIKTLEAAIDFADQIFEVDTTNITPLVTVLEDYPLRLRDDEVTEGDCKEDILRNASLTEEDYFVAPPGNIPLEGRDKSDEVTVESYKTN